MTKKIKVRSLGSIPIEAVEEFVRACAKDLLSNHDMPDEMPREFYNDWANTILEQRIKLMNERFAEKAPK